MTCRQAAEVISRSVDTSPSVAERAGLGVHSLLCGPCRRFRRQLLRLHVACGQAVGEDVATVEGELSAEARARILAALDRFLAGGS
ncbi:MAG TPA: hypothetical protein VKE74_13720 [Gemmataceae bacterium]|nr:hypothetical protein [Gemmataceae bacterium]